jgi:hypothetical protein
MIPELKGMIPFISETEIPLVYPGSGMERVKVVNRLPLPAFLAMQEVTFKQPEIIKAYTSDKREKVGMTGIMISFPSSIYTDGELPDKIQGFWSAENDERGSYVAWLASAYQLDRTSSYPIFLQTRMNAQELRTLGHSVGLKMLRFRCVQAY